jgi:hypothetical protein
MIKCTTLSIAFIEYAQIKNNTYVYETMRLCIVQHTLAIFKVYQYPHELRYFHAVCHYMEKRCPSMPCNCV